MLGLDVSFPEGVSLRQRHELTAFARCCAGRIDREHQLCGRGWLTIELALVPMPQAGAATARYDLGPIHVEARGFANDLALAIWEALGHLDQPLRASQARWTSALRASV